MRPIAFLALLILLNACALPAAFSIATLAVDGISYVTSGKSVTDHAISAVANEDCAMWRVLQARPVCRDADVPEIMVAAAPAPEMSEVPAFVIAATPEPDGSMAPEIGVSKVPAAVLAVKPAAGSPTAPATVTTEPHDEFEVTAAAFAVTSELDGSDVPVVGLATVPAADGSIAPAPDEFEVAEAMVTAVPEPGELDVPAAVLEAAPAAGGSMAPEIATIKMPAAIVPVAKRPAAMAAPKPEPLAATTETPATIGASADRGTAAKPVHFAALAARLPEMGIKPKPGRFVVLGSYLLEANARDAMKRGHDFAPRMVRVRVHGKLYHRVVSGPYARSSVGTMRRTLIGEGFPDAWTAKLCQDTLRLAPCPTAPPPLNVSAK